MAGPVAKPRLNAAPKYPMCFARVCGGVMSAMVLATTLKVPLKNPLTTRMPTASA